MTKENKEKRCIFCGKLLLSEKIPICLRCKLKGRNYAGYGAEAIGGLFVLAAGTKGVIDQNNMPDDSQV